jgi:murein DD-endopeptidase MepM/ murein hydrolase activator NlpD
VLRISLSSNRVRSVILVFVLVCLWLVWMSLSKRDSRAINSGRTSPQQQLRAAQYGAAADRLMAYLNKSQKGELYATFHDDLKANYDYETFSRHADEIIGRRGLLLKHAAPRFTGNTARIPVSAELGEWDLALRVDPAGKILSFTFHEPPSRSVRARNSVRLRLPFHGEWLVTSGGEDPATNHHIASGLAAEARAVDFEVCDESGQFKRGIDDRNENYYAYNQPILAPADGTVLVVIDGVPDNQPGKTNYFAALGNTVILQHARDEYSVLSHLQAKSISVKVGDQVTAGQQLARCGNSGNTFSPHLHFQLMTSGVPFDATGYAPYFENVWVRRKDEKAAVARKDYTPQSGAKVRQEFDSPDDSHESRRP